MLSTTTASFDADNIRDVYNGDVEFARGEARTLKAPKINTLNATKKGSDFMNSKTNSIFKDDTGGASFFSKNNSDQMGIIKTLNEIGKGQDVQAQIMIDKLQYGIKLKKENPGYSDKKLLELVDEEFQTLQIPQDQQNENQPTPSFFEKTDDINQPINLFNNYRGKI
tara:strand:- start:21 stop:521 length:501 start_codon:yes stop_codon:yes gene_type:complete